MKPNKQPKKKDPASASKAASTPLKIEASKIESSQKEAAPSAPGRSAKAKSSSSPGAKSPTELIPKTPTNGQADPAPAVAEAAPAKKVPPAPPSPKATPVLTTRKSPVRPAGKRETAPPPNFKIPPILLEGDVTPAPKAKGPGTRYALAPGAPVSQVTSALSPGQLPESYGTRRFFLAARDPRWLYASWDLTPDQQRYYNERSRDGHLVLRVFANEESTPSGPEVHVNPESRNWFLSVPKAETRYHAELGLYDRAGKWQSVTVSQHTFTPPDAPAEQLAAVEFATIPAQITFQQVVEKVQEFVTEHKPLLEAVIVAQETLREQQRQVEAEPPPAQPVPVVAVREEVRPPESPVSPPTPASLPAKGPKRAQRAKPADIPIRVERSEPWTPERIATLAQLIHIDSYRRVWMGSVEITELVRRQLEEEVASIAAAALAQQPAGGEASHPLFEFGISSPAGMKPTAKRKFWLKVNAELVLYGATEPDAKVLVADHPVKLRPDGTFSFRFALPDGRYSLPASAQSADGMETREAFLEFSRSTEYRGHVEAHPQDSALKAPRRENIG